MILLRHGETVFNRIFSATRIDPGVRDPRLTDRGREQAQTVAENLRDAQITRLISSPYTRALETAEIIAGVLDVPIAVDAMVRERGAFSCDVGSSVSKLAVTWRSIGFDHLDEIWWHEDEEHETEFLARCRQFKFRMAETTDWSTVGVVTHWGVIRAFTGQRVTNCETIRFDPTQE
jgi:glucosyl-3-phosphoglycerate phosphatase